MIFEGIYTPVITTYREDLSLDFDAWGQVIDWQIESGVHGIIVGGSTGEFFSLDEEERVAQFEFARDRIGGRVPLIAGINDMLASRCYRLAAAARTAGADALLVAAPPYSLPSQEELAVHCLEVDRAAGLPILLYNYPARTGVGMEEAFLRRIAREDNFCAIKESSGDAHRLRLLAGDFPQLQISAGAEDQVLEFFAWGARSWVSVIANFLPHEAVSLYERCVLQGDFEAGRRMLKRLLPLMHRLERGGSFIQSVKAACGMRRRPGGLVRPPLQALNGPSVRDLEAILDNCLADDS